MVSVPETGGTADAWEADAAAGDSQGAVWLGGAAPAIDSQGNVWVATGNGAVTSGPTPDGSDSVVELSPTMQLLQSFTPSTWATDNATDLDLGSSVPALMGNGFVFQAGKSSTAYLLKESALGGVGGQVAELKPFCGSVVDGGYAFTTNVLYTPCHNGITAVKVTDTHEKLKIRVEWTSRSGSTGPPIVAFGKVWTLSQSGMLYGLSKANGHVVEKITVGVPANHFPTATAADGLLLVPTSDRVLAFG